MLTPIMSLTYVPSGTTHGDLVLRVGTWVYRSDTYYYALDRGIGQRSNVPGAIHTMLTGWITSIKACADGEAVLLPHAFFDQSSGWLRCVRQGEVFEIIDGWSSVEGWSFYPSDFHEKAQQITDFKGMDGCEPVQIERSDLLAQVTASLEQIYA